MPANLPYLPSPGSIKTALDKIRSAATPERVTGDFVQTKLQIKGGTGTSIPPFLKKIGFVNSDGRPSEIYSRFRNSQPSGLAVAQALRIGFRELFEANEYCYDLSNKDLISLICQVTGASAESSVAKLTASSFNNLKSYADFDAKPNQLDIILGDQTGGQQTGGQHVPPSRSPAEEAKLGLNLSYTINLNLPATSDQAVFNAIFRSLREHLLDEK